MRYTTARFGEVAHLFGEFAEGRPISAASGVNIELYQPSAGGAAVALTVSGCTEISGSRAGGFATYYWPTSGITTQPTNQVEYLYVMRDAQTTRVQKGKLVLGGYPDESAISNYRDAVWLNVHDDEGAAGTAFPLGTPNNPVNNLADALAIISGFDLPRTIRLHGLLSGVAEDLSEYVLIGVDPDRDAIEFVAGAITSGMSFQNVGIHGVLNGAVTADRCVVGRASETVSGVDGLFNRCGSAGTLVLASGATVNGLEFAGRSIFGTTIDFSAGGECRLLTGDAVGIFLVRNMISANSIFALAGVGANVTLESTCTAGIARVAGVGELVDNSNGTTVIDSLLRGSRVDVAVSTRMEAGTLVGLSGATISGIADQVWDEMISGHTISGSTGRNLFDARRHITNDREIDDTNPAQWREIVYDDDAVTPLQTADLTDIDGVPISDANSPAGVMVAKRTVVP